jgi:uncharacterized DUF497 family protein
MTTSNGTTPKPLRTSSTMACHLSVRASFADSFAVGRIDDRKDYGEDRFTMIGMYTERDDRVRIITARRATRHEQDDYFQQNR